MRLGRDANHGAGVRPRQDERKRLTWLGKAVLDDGVRADSVLVVDRLDLVGQQAEQHAAYVERVEAARGATDCTLAFSRSGVPLPSVSTSSVRRSRAFRIFAESNSRSKHLGMKSVAPNRMASTADRKRGRPRRSPTPRYSLARVTGTQ